MALLKPRSEIRNHKSNQISLCIVTDSHPRIVGGVEMSIEKISEGLSRKGIDVSVITTRFSSGIPAVEKKEGVTLIRVRVPAFLRRAWFSVFAAWALIRRPNPADIIIGSTFGGVLPAFLGSLILRKKRLMLVHEVLGRRWFGIETNLLKSLFYYISEAVMIRFPFDRIVAVSEYTRNELVRMGIRQEKIDVIHHGVSDDVKKADCDPQPIRRELGFSPDDFLFLAYGRLGITKGFQFLAEAVPEIVRQAPGARFLFVLSDYVPRVRLAVTKALAAVSSNRYRLYDAVPREELIRYINAVDCVVVPSLTEGFGFTAAEACAAGKIVVATNAGALPEVVSGRYLLVNPASTEALIRGCVDAYNGKFVTMPVRDFNWEHAIDEWEKEFRSMKG